MKHIKWLASLLVLSLLLCLLPSAALAAPAEDVDEGEVTEEEPAPVPEEEPAEEPAVEPDEEADAEAPAEKEAEAPNEEDADGPVTVAQDEIFYATAEDTVYNNGGTVYNNGGTVYNNGGLVYNNGGLVYNNGGVVYSNDGTVYNNGGTVYRNGATVYTFDGDVQEPRIYGYYQLAFAEDYSALIDLEGLTEDGSLDAEGSCIIRPHEGFTIVEAETDAGELTENEDGSWTLSGLKADATLRLVLRADAPEFDLAEGTYAEEQTLTITAPEGTQVYYTTDGTEPDAETGILYEEPVVLNEGVTVTAVALAQGAEPSELTVADYAFLTITAPSFADVEAGYTTPAAAAFTVENAGSVDAEVTGVSLEGKNASSFTLNSKNGAVVKAGKTNTSSWTLRPVANLAAGTYKANVVFTLAGGETVKMEIQFVVK